VLISKTQDNARRRAAPCVVLRAVNVYAAARADRCKKITDDNNTCDSIAAGAHVFLSTKYATNG